MFAWNMQPKLTQLDTNKSVENDFSSRITMNDRAHSFAIRHSSDSSWSRIWTNTLCCAWSSRAVTDEKGNRTRKAYSNLRQLPVSDVPGCILTSRSFLTRTTDAMRQLLSIRCEKELIALQTLSGPLGSFPLPDMSCYFGFPCSLSLSDTNVHPLVPSQPFRSPLLRPITTLKT